MLRALRWMRYKPRCLAVKSVLILPEYWGSGAAILLIDEMASRARAKGYTWVDLSLTSDDNPYTPHLAERMGGESTSATASRQESGRRSCHLLQNPPRGRLKAYRFSKESVKRRGQR